jgi:hypothetical protein
MNYSGVASQIPEASELERIHPGAPDFVVWRTGHCPVRQPRHQAVGFRPLELLTMGPLDSPVVHWTGPVHCPLRLLRLL